MLTYVFGIAIVLLSSTDCEASDDHTVNVSLPRYVEVGKNVTIHCDYSPDNNIYSVKWYMGQYEIFRWIPNDVPHKQVFPLNGVSVDINNSSGNNLVLNNLQTIATGRYICEVTWEAPLFQSINRGKLMFVFEKPKGEPVLTVDNDKVSCTSPPAHPRPSIIWFLNGVQTMGTPPRTKQNDRQLKNFFSLFTVGNETSTHDHANLTCVVQIGDIYRAQKSIIL
uniref:Uncharacterized protein LOC114338590 n=1 Tax=Diabrotica virgifera virgifera TaxID=50390 RepID=A0A6P7GFR4_DIAVI